jgi:hypothetical protein
VLQQAEELLERVRADDQRSHQENVGVFGARLKEDPRIGNFCAGIFFECTRLVLAPGDRMKGLGEFLVLITGRHHGNRWRLITNIDRLGERFHLKDSFQCCENR